MESPGDKWSKVLKKSLIFFYGLGFHDLIAGRGKAVRLVENEGIGRKETRDGASSDYRSDIFH
jgi:hypothetical protein